jgi:hypothetical protein
MFFEELTASLQPVSVKPSQATRIVKKRHARKAGINYLE